MPSPSPSPVSSTKAPVVAAPKAGKEQFFRVEKTYRVPRGAGAYMLREGKIISSVGYDIPSLVDLGIELTEVNPGTKLEVRATAE